MDACKKKTWVFVSVCCVCVCCGDHLCEFAMAGPIVDASTSNLV